MSKKHDRPESSTIPTIPTIPTTVAQIPPTPEKTQMPETTTPPAATETTLIKPEDTTLATVSPDVEASRILASRLPARYRGDVLMLKRPSPEDLFNIVLKLPQAQQDKMLELVRKLNPKKQGLHTTRQGFSPTQVRLYQGTGTDIARPKATLKGQFYTADSRVLGEKFTCAVLTVVEGRIMWPQRPEKGAAVSTDGPVSKMPLCYSLDRLEGSRYGSCATCPNSTKQYTMGGCAREVIVYFMDSEMTGVYELRFSKTSEGAGNQLLKILNKSENPWDRWFVFESAERTDSVKDYNWCVQKISPVNHATDATKNDTPKELHPLFTALSKIIDVDVYFAGLADVYDRSKSSTEAGVGAGSAADTADEKALLTPGGDDNPDYSDGGAKNV